MVFVLSVLVLLACVCSDGCGASDSTPIRRFAFGSNPVAETTLVTPDMIYAVASGYGFDLGTTPQTLAKGGGVTSRSPFYFSVTVPEGNYAVTVTLGDAQDESQTTIKAESRRLMVENARTAAGQFVTRMFIVNVRTPQLPPPPRNAPGGTEVRLNERENGPQGLALHWDDKLTLEFSGAHPCLRALEIAPVNCPTIFLAGDSTVTDQPQEPAASWGQMLPRFFRSGVAVANHAESGETLKSFLTGLRLDKILSQIKRGDYLFIQFGHNDSKANWPQTYAEAGNTYDAYLRVYIAEARRRGATPVLVTSPHRRQFDSGGKVRNTHGDYPAAVRAVALETGTACIDLTSMSAAFYEALGPEKSAQAFIDPTHHNAYGAYELARCVAAGIAAQRLELTTLLTEDALPFDPARPDPIETFSVPPSPGRMTQAPRGN